MSFHSSQNTAPRDPPERVSRAASVKDQTLDKSRPNQKYYITYCTSMADAKQFLPLSPAVFHMRLCLAKGERHGYAIKREIAERTAGKLTLRAGALYGAISKLLEPGLIADSDERPDPHLDDERRRYCKLTPLGLRAAPAEGARVRELILLASVNVGLANG